jgi:nucleoside-diphosphate-sugar epimerase
MNILIVGGNRFIGKGLAEKLSSEHSITVFNRSGNGPENVSIIQGDRNVAEDIEKIPFDSFDLVIDFCLFKPEQFELFKNFIPSEVKYVFISSASVGKQDWGPYSKEKEGCEALVTSYFNNFTIIRPPYIDGENSHRPRTAQIINQIENNVPVTVDGDGEYLINIVWADDMINFIYQLVHKDLNNSIIEVGSYTNIKLNDYIKIISTFLRMGVAVEEGQPAWAPALNLDMKTNEYTTYFGKVEDKLDNFYKWYKEIGELKYGYREETI